MTSNRKRNTPNPLCTDTTCANDRNQDILTCSKCNRSVHYHCSKLPAYMISAFNDDRRINCNFVCPNCVTVSKELLALIPRSQPSLKTAAELSKLKETIKENETTIKKLKTTEQQLDMVESQRDEILQLTKRMSDDPALHTVEYVDNKLTKKLDDFRTEILSTIKEQCTKSYAAAASADQEVTPSKK